MSDLMFNTIILSITSTGICVVLAVVVWLRIRSSSKLDKEDSELHDQRTAAVLMKTGDWANSAIKVVIGVFLGVAIHAVAELMLSGAWFSVLIIAVLSAGLFLIVLLHKRIGDKLFPSGIRPARKRKTKPKVPLSRRLSLPAGLFLGVVLAALGLNDPLIGWLF